MQTKIPKTKNPANRIKWGPVPSGRQVNLGTDQATKQARKTRKGAAEWLYKCDRSYILTGKHIFNVDQRTTLEERANGGSATLYRPLNPMDRFPEESLEEYVARLKQYIAREKAKKAAAEAG